MDVKEISTTNLLVKHYAGSHSYGTNIETSDVDFRGIFCADPISVRTPFFPVREVVDSSEEDTKYYELSHFMKLCLDCNPNIIETLWVDDSDIVFQTNAYKILRDHRHEFLSSKIAFTTSGYAIAQLKRMKGSKKHANYLPALNILLDVLKSGLKQGLIDSRFVFNHCGHFVADFLEIDNKKRTNTSFASLNDFLEYVGVDAKIIQDIKKIVIPRQSSFVSLVQYFGKKKMLKFDISNWQQDHRLVPYGHNIFGMYSAPSHTLYSDDGSLNTVFEGDREDLPPPLLIIKYNAEEYKHQKDMYRKFWEWRNNRNSIRLSMEEDFGYDGKHAMHLVRLLRMGEEALVRGEIVVKRPDAEELLDIRRGKWSYEELITYAEEMDNKIRGKLYETTSLRKYPDLQVAAKVLMKIQDEVWND